MKDGHYDPKTLSISFKDNDINTLLANYLECKDSDTDSDENTDSSKKSIELLILSDTPIRYRGAHSHYASLHAHDALSRYRLFTICARYTCYFNFIFFYPNSNRFMLLIRPMVNCI